MKKTLQINIGGVNFTIEEDAYQTLNNYLEAVKKHFSSYESCDEIIADIENRIAEKFFIKSDKGGIIETEDVEKIIKSMGSVADFEAFQEEDDLSKNETKKIQSSTEKTETKEPKIPTKYVRDGKRKALAGVLAGFAHRLTIDVVWLRILFIMFSVGLIEIGVGGFLILAYIVCWIAFPEDNNLLENEKTKKFYRNTDHKVLGGVATGLSAYLGIDLVLLRIIFVCSVLFFGFGFIAYILLWIVAPKAMTLTQKMESKGQAVTIENIESSIKNNNTQNNVRQESSLGKLLLFPFRLIGIILSALGKIIKPVGSLIKIFAGLILLILGATLSLAVLLSTGVFFGLFTDTAFHNNADFLGLLSQEIPTIGGFFAFLATFIPSAAITIIGLSFITGQSKGNRNFWLTSLGLWFAGIIGLGIISAEYAVNLSHENGYTQETNLTLPANTLYLDVEDSKFDKDGRYQTSVVLETSENENITFVKKFSSKGKNDDVALKYAKNIRYEVNQTDSMIIFPQSFQLTGKKALRDQSLENTLKIPKNKRFKMTEKFVNRLYSKRYRLTEDFGIESESIEKFTFIMNEDNKIVCADCPVLTKEEKEALENNDYSDEKSIIDNQDFKDLGEYKKNFNIENFDKLKIGGSFIVAVKYGETTKLDVYCEDKDDLNDLEAKVKAGTLEIEFQDTFIGRRHKVNIIITTPNLNALDISGASIVKVVGFKNQNTFDAEVSGASKVAIDLNVINLNVNTSGASSIICKGKTEKLQLELSGSSNFYGKNLKTDNASINATGASTAEISTIKNLKTNLSGASSINKE
jgi:phage shock protein PspC (stress-responsive transcriptional regulator)